MSKFERAMAGVVGWAYVTLAGRPLLSMLLSLLFLVARGAIYCLVIYGFALFLLKHLPR